MSHTPVIEIIIIKEPSPHPSSKNNQPAPKKIIRGPHFRPQRHSVRGRQPILKRGVR